MAGVNQILLELNRPIVSIDTSKVYLLEDTTEQRIIPVISWADSVKRSIMIDYKWKGGIQYKIVLTDGAIVDWYGMANDTLNRLFIAKKLDEYGNAEVLMSGIPADYNVIIELLDGRKEVIRSLNVPRGTSETKIDFNLLKPQAYRLRFIHDLNGNGKWDTGNFSTKTQPEPIFYHPTQIEVKPQLGRRSSRRT